MKFRSWFAILAGAWLLPSSFAWGGEVHVAAAASLKEALNKIAADYVAQHPKTSIVRVFGASGAVAKQVENGLGADVFISANQEWMTYLDDRALTDAKSKTTWVTNTLVVVGAKPGTLKTLAELVNVEKIAIGSPKSVPAGEYAQAAFVAAGIAEKLKDKLILAQDVRDALKYAELGEVNAALVYRTDALASAKVSTLLEVPRALYPEIAYPMALTVSGSRKDEAVQFFAYLQSPDAQRVLQAYGFTVPAKK